MSNESYFIRSVNHLLRLTWVLIICVAASIAFFLGNAMGLFRWQPTNHGLASATVSSVQNTGNQGTWQAPDTSQISEEPEADLIYYGRELIAHTAAYLGPKGKILSISNGMNCQNCHLKAGTVPFGNNYGKVASTYPKLRNRSGMVEGFAKRINDCIERSLNGQKLDEDSREMKAMVAYLKWVGKDVKKGETPDGFGLIEVPMLNRPANPKRGQAVYQQYCGRCHGDNGQGEMAENGLEWKYPPLYGEYSYNKGAGLYRLSKFAAYVKSNMPYGVTYENPFLTDEEAWDVAAFVNSMPRPEKDLSEDWPDLSKKPIDHPFGPYSDSFSEEQHKYGPFEPIKAQYQ